MIERRKATQGDDDTWALSYVTGIASQVGFDPKYVFIDAMQRGAEEEVTAFDASVARLYQIMSQNAGFKTDSVREIEEKVHEAERKRMAAVKERDEANQKRDTVEEERRELSQTLEEKERKIKQMEDEKKRSVQHWKERQRKGRPKRRKRCWSCRKS